MSNRESYRVNMPIRVISNSLSSFSICLFVNMAYKLEIRKSIYNLAGRVVPKAERIQILENQNTSYRLINWTTANCD